MSCEHGDRFDQMSLTCREPSKSLINCQLSPAYYRAEPWSSAEKKKRVKRDFKLAGVNFHLPDWHEVLHEIPKALINRLGVMITGTPPPDPENPPPEEEEGGEEDVDVIVTEVPGNALSPDESEQGELPAQSRE